MSQSQIITMEIESAKKRLEHRYGIKAEIIGWETEFNNKEVMSPMDIIKWTAEALDLEPARLFADKRDKQEVTDARHISRYIIRREFHNLSLPAIAALYSKKNHTVVIHSINAYKELFKSDSNFREKILKVETYITIKTSIKYRKTMKSIQKIELQRDYLASRAAKGSVSADSQKRLAELNRELLEMQEEARPVFASLNMSEEWVLEQYKANQENNLTT